METYLEHYEGLFVERHLGIGWLDRSLCWRKHSGSTSIAPSCFGTMAEPFITKETKLKPIPIGQHQMPCQFLFELPFAKMHTCISFKI